MLHLSIAESEYLFLQIFILQEKVSVVTGNLVARETWFLTSCNRNWLFYDDLMIFHFQILSVNLCCRFYVS